MRTRKIVGTKVVVSQQFDLEQIEAHIILCMLSYKQVYSSTQLNISIYPEQLMC